MVENKKAREEFLSQLSLQNCLKETEAISERFPWRLSGTESAKDAAYYITNRLKEVGVAAKTLEFTGYLNIPEKATLRLTYPDPIEITCTASAQCGSTPKDGIETEVVWLGQGGESDYIGKDVEGKIVLTELSYSPPRPEKARLAMLNKAAGLIIMNWGPDDNPLNPNGTVKPIWGNPTPETIHLMDNIPPVVGISRKDGCQLRDRLKKGERIKAFMHVNAPREWMTTYMPYAEIKAPNNEKGDFILIAGHMDSWAKGASDNAAANAIKMELARVLEKNKNMLKHDIRFVFWQGHENGIMEGSTWFAERFWDELDENCIAYLIYDTAGLENASIWRSDSTSEIVYFHKNIEDVVIPNISKIRNKGMRTGDNSFFGMGIPSISSWMVHTEEEIKSWNNATLGIWYHSDDDTMEHIDKDVLDVCLRMYGAYAWELATVDVYPMTFDIVADDIINRIEYLIDLTKDREDMEETLKLNEALKIGKIFKEKAIHLKALTEKASNHQKIDHSFNLNLLNQVIKKVSRSINAVKLTVSGRYEQDTYGLSALNHELPGTESIEKLYSLTANSHEYHLYTTRAVRERNKVTDSLRHAIWLMDLVLN